MPSRSLFIAPAAKADLKDIYHYGLRQWGEAQSDRYLGIIKATLWSLIEQPFIGVERPELLSEIHSLTIESHILFYRATNSRVEVIRVLHGRQDPMRHLK